MDERTSSRIGSVPHNIASGHFLGSAAIVAGDVDNDGLVDIVIAAQAPARTLNVSYSCDLYAFINNRNGEFDRRYVASVSMAGFSSPSLALADFNKDGNIDIAIAAKRNVGSMNVSTDMNIYVLYGDGTGNFKQK